MATSAILAIDIPILLIDTCSILDIMRDPTRDASRTHDRQAAIDLVIAAEAGKLACLMAEQVATEFAEHDQLVQDEAAQKIKKVREQIDRVNQIAAVFGASATVNLNHLDDHVARARAVVGRWLTQLQMVVPSRHVPAMAFARMNAGIAPATRGKESSKDCLVYETVLEKVSSLRLAGGVAPIVFLSSNTKEYLTPGGTLKPEIVLEFGNLNIDYAPNMSAAKHALGL